MIRYADNGFYLLDFSQANAQANLFRYKTSLLAHCCSEETAKVNGHTVCRGNISSEVCASHHALAGRMKEELPVFLSNKQ